MINQTREKEVWSRVMAASKEAPVPQSRDIPVTKSGGLTEKELLELLGDEAMDAHTYRNLAARSQGNARKTLEQISMEEQGHFRLLSAVFFILTGRKPMVERPESPRFDTVQGALRHQYQGELNGAARYRSVAKTAGSFDSLFRDLGDDEERHSRLILKLLGELL